MGFHSVIKNDAGTWCEETPLCLFMFKGAGEVSKLLVLLESGNQNP